MTINQYLDNIKSNVQNEISYLSSVHILKKIYDIENDSISKEELDNLFKDYNTYIRYLNDFAGPIYRRYNSSTQEIYTDLCNTLGLDVDLEYLFEMSISKIEKQSASRIMQIEDDDFKIMTIEKFEKRLDELEKTPYYQENIDRLKSRVANARSQFNLVRRALNL
jgi:hypothetical protein